MPVTFPMDVSPFCPVGNKTVGHRIVNESDYDEMNDWAVYPISQREIIRSFAAYNALDLTFAHKLSDLKATPKLRDELLYNELAYRIISAFPCVNIDRGTFIGRPLKLTEGLTDVASIWRKNISGVTLAGRVVGNYTLLRDNIRVRPQPIDAGEEEEFGINQLTRKFNVIMEMDPITLLQEDQIRMADGRILDIESVADAECLELLQRVQASDRGARWQ